MIAPESSKKRIADLEPVEFQSLTSHDGLCLRLGPFNCRIRVPVETIREPLRQLYSDYPMAGREEALNFRVKLVPRRNFPVLHRRMVRFSVDGQCPHEDMPAPQALAVLEWGLNLVIAMRAHCFLMLHSAVLERNGIGLLLPAAPGFGKSTLCAALAHRGWRLLSDEFGLIRPSSGNFEPLPRPIALKNESIEVFRAFAPDAVIGPSIPGTRKGTVAHVKAPTPSVLQQAVPATPGLIVFPRWQANDSLSLDRLSMSEGFMMVAMNAFNYELLGEAAFDAVAGVIRRSACYRMVYTDLDDAIAAIDSLAEERAARET